MLIPVYIQYQSQFYVSKNQIKKSLFFKFSLIFQDYLEHVRNRYYKVASNPEEKRAQENLDSFIADLAEAK